jgi:hypothetical protein
MAAYLSANSMSQNLLQAAANRSSIQEFPNILQNPKVQCRVHENPPLVSILSQMNPVHIIPSYFFKIQLNIK